MLNALVDGVRSSPAKGLHGTCRACLQPVLAKCGPIRIAHWAHKARAACEFSREPETEWHRQWKSLFPSDYQECLDKDEQGITHIADIRLPHGLVIEFQHSHICPQERIERERFYKTMWWVVDGSRLSRDLPRFANATRSFHSLWQGVYVTQYPEEAFAPSWLTSEVPVFFDFRQREGLPAQMERLTQPMWCLLPSRIGSSAVVVAVSRSGFLQWAHDPSYLGLSKAYLEKAAEILDLQQQVKSGRQRAAQMLALSRGGRTQRRRYPRF